MAQRLLAATRASEMIGRIGGEEFGWLLPEATADEALLAAERARCAVAEADFGQVGRLTVSVGVATLAGTRVVGADVVEVEPAYDHAEITTVAAAHVCYELLALMALGG